MEFQGKVHEFPSVTLACIKSGLTQILIILLKLFFCIPSSLYWLKD